MVPYDHRQAGNQTLCTHGGTQPVHPMVACINLSHTIPIKLEAPKALEHKPQASLSTCPKLSPETLDFAAHTTSKTAAA